MAHQQPPQCFSQPVAGCNVDERLETKVFVKKLVTGLGRQVATNAKVGSNRRIPMGGAGGVMSIAGGCVALTATATKLEDDEVDILYCRQAKPILQQKIPKNLSNPSLAFLCVKACQPKGY